jgi:alpha-ketoglutarate-dependent taurine dioxygenase
MFCRDANNRSNSRPYPEPHQRTSSESSLILKSRDARKNSRRTILELHNNLGLTASLITRRFVFTFTENPAKETTVLLTTNSK